MSSARMLSLFIIFICFAAINATVYRVGANETYTNIPDAISAATAGDTILVTDGTYSGHVLIDKSLVIMSENGYLNTFVEGIFGLDADEITIDGFTFESLGAQGIIIRNNSNDHIIRNNFINQRDTGIDFEEESNSTHVLITDNIIQGDASDALSIGGYGGHIITDNVIQNCSGAGITVREDVVDIVRIQNNEISDCRTNAIGVFGPALIDNNTLQRTDWALIFVSETVTIEIMITNNILVDATGIAIATRGYTKIENNLIEGNGDDGVLVSDINSGYVTIKDNTIVNNAASGIQIRNNALIEHNTVTGNGEYGIYIRSVSSKAIVRNNDVKNNVRAGIRVLGNSLIEANIIEENEGGIIVEPMVSEASIYDNEVRNNTLSGIILKMGAVLRGNIIDNNEGDGVRILDADNLGQQAAPNLGNDSDEEAGYNVLINNEYFDIANNSPNEISAYRNFWGLTEDTQIAERIFDKNDDENMGTVNFSPCLLEDPTDIAYEEELLPNQTELWYAYPNPFNPETQINYTLTEPTEVTLAVYDLLGRKIKDFVENEYTYAGTYSFTWDGLTNERKKCASGTYIIVLETRNDLITQKILLVR